MTKKLVTYLAGPIEDVEDSGSGWRDRLTPQLIEIFGSRLMIQDPTKNEGAKIGLEDEIISISEAKRRLNGWKNSGHYDKFDQAVKCIIDTDISMIRACDFIIAFLKFRTSKEKVIMGGTIGELQHAYDHNIRIYSVCYDNIADMNCWVLGLTRSKGNQLFKSFNQLLEALKTDYKDYILTEAERKKFQSLRESEKTVVQLQEQIRNLQDSLNQKLADLNKLKGELC